MKILLVNPPIRENAPPVNFPIGLGTIANVLCHEGHDVDAKFCKDCGARL